MLLVALAVGAAVLTYVVGEALFADGSPNLDELDYRNQASALRHGELTLDAAERIPSFRPYLSGVEDGEVIFTHQPLWPAALAVVDAVGLPARTAAAATAAGAVLAFALFAHEITTSRRTTLLATALLAASPLFLLQSATLLAYTPTFALAFATLGLLLRSLRTGSRGLAVGAGLTAGLLLFNRPYDAVLLAVPTVAVVLLGPWRARLRPVLAPLVLGVAPGFVMLLAYNQAVMGSPLRFPYTVHGHDTIGFGPRVSFVAGPAPLFDFGIAEAWTALGRQLTQVPRFTAGSLLVVMLAAVGAVLRPWSWSKALLALLVVVFPFGYFFWWTTWNTSNFGLHEFLGPAYYYPSIGALLVLAAIALDRLLDRSVPLGAILLVAMALVTAMHLRDIAQLNRDFARSRESLLELATGVDAEPRVVFTPRSYEHDPYVHFYNDAELDAPVLYALDLGSPNAVVLAAMPDRTGYRVWHEAERDGLFGPRVTQIEQLELVDVGDGVEIVARFERPPDLREVFAYGATEGADDPLIVDVGDCDPTCEVRWQLTDDALIGPSGERPLDDADDQAVSIGFGLSGDGSTEVADRYEAGFSLARVDDRLLLVTPPETWHQYAFPDGQTPWAPEDLDDVLSTEVTT